MKSLEIFSDIKFENGNDFIYVKSDSKEINIELSSKKLIFELKRSVFKDSFFVIAIKIHQLTKASGIKVFIKTSSKTLVSFGDSPFYLFKLLLLKFSKVIL